MLCEAPASLRNYKKVSPVHPFQLRQRRNTEPRERDAARGLSSFDKWGQWNLSTGSKYFFTDLFLPNFRIDWYARARQPCRGNLPSGMWLRWKNSQGMRTDFSCCLLDVEEKGVKTKVYPNTDITRWRAVWCIAKVYSWMLWKHSPLLCETLGGNTIILKLDIVDVKNWRHIRRKSVECLMHPHPPMFIKKSWFFILNKSAL